MGELVLGILVGMVFSAPIVFVLTATGAQKVWRCVPCVDGKPVKQ